MNAAQPGMIGSAIGERRKMKRSIFVKVEWDEDAQVWVATSDDIGLVNAAINRVIHAGARTKNPPRLFYTLARHRGLYRRWLMFAGIVAGHFA